jgi:hypothetical protein
MSKPTLTIARRLFKRRNPGTAFNVVWERRPVKTDAGWCSSVLVTADGFRPKVLRLYSDVDGIALF